MPGYQWKIVIDPNTASSAKLCFNNGNGTWDNNNKADYTISVGVYGISNRNVTSLSK
jgi:hypothetical protein